MKQILILLTFLLASAVADAQISAGQLNVQNYGNFYRISVNGPVFNNYYPKPDSASLRIVVICKQTMQYEVNYLPINGHVDYKLGGINYIGATVFWWKNGVKVSQTSLPTACSFFLNPLQCFQKI